MLEREISSGICPPVQLIKRDWWTVHAMQISLLRGGSEICLHVDLFSNGKADLTENISILLEMMAPISSCLIRKSHLPRGHRFMRVSRFQMTANAVSRFLCWMKNRMPVERTNCWSRALEKWRITWSYHAKHHGRCRTCTVSMVTVKALGGDCIRINEACCCFRHIIWTFQEI